MKRLAPGLLLLLLPAAALADGTTPRQDAAAQERYAAAAKYSFAHGGLSFLVHRDGNTVYEEYALGRKPSEPHQLYSGTKSFFGLAVACMIEDGLIKDLDELACETLTEWKADPRKRKITIRHLLQLTSGLDPGSTRTLRGVRRGVSDKYAYAVKLACTTEPGASFHYAPAHYYALGALMQRKLAGSGDKDPLAYLKRRLLDPIGLQVAKWQRDAAGNPQTPSGAFLTAREWIKLGELVRRRGAWKGKQLVDAKRLAACFVGSKANPGYGLTWWLPTAKGGLDPRGLPWPPCNAPRDTVMAAGFSNQRLYVIPSRKLVVVRQARPDRSWSDAEQLRLLLGLPKPTAAETNAQRAQRAQRAKAEAKQQLAKYDADHDGEVSEQEAPRLVRPFFRFLDRDQSGGLDLSELEAAALRRLERRARRARQ